MKKATLFLSAVLLVFSGAAAELYREFQPVRTSRIRENTEWSVTYTYNALDSRHPRLLLIGDSICNAYQDTVRRKLGKVMNITFWATSKCVTDPDYFRELDLILSSYHYDVISFNNGLHSLTTDRGEWRNAYRGAVDFIRRKCPDARLFLTSNTPLRDNSDGTPNSSWYELGYGVNRMISLVSSDRWGKLKGSRIRNPSQKIYAGDSGRYLDSPPSRMRGTPQPVLWPVINQSGSSAVLFPFHVSACNILFVDGHVTSLAGKIPEEYYASPVAKAFTSSRRDDSNPWNLHE